MTTTYTPTETNDLNGGIQRKYASPNGYTASVIQSPFSYGGGQGLWELAVMNRDGYIDYSTPITDDVIGYLTEDEVQALLARIEALPDPASGDPS